MHLRNTRKSGSQATLESLSEKQSHLYPRACGTSRPQLEVRSTAMIDEEAKACSAAPASIRLYCSNMSRKNHHYGMIIFEHEKCLHCGKWDRFF